MCVSSRSLAIVILMFCAGPLSEPVHARPAVIHEEERTALPEQYWGGSGVCLFGSDLLVSAHRQHASNPERGVFAVVRFVRQAGGEWHFLGELATVDYDANADIWMDEQLACDGPIAAFSTPVGDSFILERTSSGWQVTSLGHNGSDAAVYGDAVAIGGQWGSPTSAAVYRKNASGVWNDVSYAVGNPGDRMDVEIVGPHFVGLANAELVASGDNYNLNGQGNPVSDTQVFDLIDGSWRLTTTLPQNHRIGTVVGERVALLMDSWTEPGDVGSLFTRDASGAWTVKHTLLSDEFFSAGNILVSNGRAFVRGDREAGEIAVFREEAPRRYRHEATLTASDVPNAPPFSNPLFAFSVDGEWVAAVGRSKPDIYLFHVPATLPTPQRLEQTFESASAADWSVWGKTDWRLVNSNGSRVYRQLNTQGDARAVLETSEGTDQSVQADVRIQSVIGTVSWAGLMVRYTDPQNFYYLLVKNNSVQIRRIVNGVFGPIATAPFNLVVGRTYRFRLEAIGSRLRAFVNGAMVAEVIDDSHVHGKAGLTMWRAVTEYDNVVVTSSPQVQLFTDTFDSSHQAQEVPWSSTPASAWSYVGVDGADRLYRQSRVSGSPRAVNGGPTKDQIIAARIRPRAFSADRKGSVGLMARYVDHFNYYYVLLTHTGRVILGKSVSGSFHHFDQASVTVNTNTTYNVRVEVIGSSLRAYVNDRLMVEAQDATFLEGRYGMITFQAAADFDNFNVIRP